MWWKSAVNFSFFLSFATFRMRSSACDTLTRHCVRRVLCWRAFPLVPALRSTGSAALGSATDRSATEPSALFAGFVATMAGSDFSCPCIDMQAGEKWRETLVKANVACEALLFLASPESLASDECRREVRRAEDDRKDVIVAILRDVTIDDPRLAGYTDRQIMDLSTNPREERVDVEHKGQRHLIDFNRAALNAILAKLIDRGIAPDAFAWPPRHNPKALPYPGLDAFDEDSTGIFFGREADVMAGIRDLRQIRHRGSPRLLVIQAASGAGKSSFLRAGLWPRLRRSAEFVPLAILRPATGIVTGGNGLGRGLADWFCERRRQVAPGTIDVELMAGDAATSAQRLASHMSAGVALVAEERALNLAEGQAPSRLSPLIAIDQGEELFAA